MTVKVLKLLDGEHGPAESREMAGEPDGKADSDEPETPLSPPPRASFLHRDAKLSQLGALHSPPPTSPLSLVSISSPLISSSWLLKAELLLNLENLKDILIPACGTDVGSDYWNIDRKLTIRTEDSFVLLCNTPHPAFDVFPTDTL